MDILLNLGRFISNQLILPFINLLLYSNLWIALAAICMCWQTQLLLVGQLHFSPFTLFVLFSTLFLYAIHRIVGLNKVKAFTQQGRYQVISTFKSHIILYAIMAGALAGYFFLHLSVQLQWSMVIPGFISLAYVLPVLYQRKRLRDIGLIKIFLIAVVWAFVTVYLCGLEMGIKLQEGLWISFLERSLFIFAITIPFDIRDSEIDRTAGVKTLPTAMGIDSAIYLALAALMLAAGLASLNYSQNLYALADLLALYLSYILSGILIWLSPNQKHDYYFTGLMDGTMIFSFLFVWIL